MNQDDESIRVQARLLRPAVAATSMRIGVVTFVAWVVSFFLFTYATDGGRQQLAEEGFLPLLLSWIVLSLLTCVGYGLGYAIMRQIAPGNKEFTEREVLKLSLGESVLATGGGFVLAFIPMTLTATPMIMLTWTFFVGFLFSFAAIFPKYTAGWRRAVVDGYGIRD